MPQQVISFLNESAPTKSTDQNSSALINMYMIADTDQGKYEQAAYFTPGASLFTTLGTSPLRTMVEHQGIMYAVSGNTVYSITTTPAVTTLGTIGTSTGYARIVFTSNYLMVIDGVGPYYYNIPTAVYGKVPLITDGNFVNTVTVTNGGSGYGSSSTVSDTGATFTTQATYHPVIVGGVITAINITNLGKGYSIAPTIVITPVGGGSGAAATATVQTNALSGAEVDGTTQDEFGILLENNSQTWFSSSISDLRSWPPLSFAATTGNYENLVGVASLHRELWMFQEQTTEIWDNVGTVNFTWGRNSSAYIEWGLAAKASLAKGNNTLFWLGQEAAGGPVVVMASGYIPTVISNPGITYQLSTYTTISDAIGFVYQQEGHEFYVLTLPTAGVTWVYDVSTQQWHQRQSLISAVQTRWFPSCYCFFSDTQLVGDSQSGNIYIMDMTNFTENGTAITRTFISHPFYTAGTWIYTNRLQIDFDTTPGASLNTINLFVSRDGGKTYGSAKAAVPVQDSNGQWRVYWNRLGKAKTFVFKITTSMNNKFIILGATVFIGSGSI